MVGADESTELWRHPPGIGRLYVLQFLTNRYKGVDSLKVSK